MKRTGKRFLGPVADVEGRSRGSLGGMKPAGKGVKDQTMLSRGLHVEMLEPRPKDIIGFLAAVGVCFLVISLLVGLAGIGA